ncbi:hypothetical protein [Xanthomonas maliensis]|uniref:hypothetical protein n=1 Tax=Xanthomonas maliensis TaxID=1321368 RepID=UPI00039FEEBB|nr:hypothetical protein [Xanthomonas maliensis]KAB7771792.1 hypothetical protein CKY51_01855 [Xanthomonas maliensis]
MRMRPVLSALVLVGCVPWIATAQTTTEERLRDALRQTSAQLRQVQAELAQQQLATAAAQREHEAQPPAPPAASAPSDAARTAALQREVAQLRQALEQERTQHARALATQQQTAAQQQQQQQQQALADARSQTQARVSRCNSAGDALYASGRSLAGLYRDPAFVRFVRHRGHELFGMTRVAEENRVHALEDTLADQHARLRTCLDGRDAPPPQSAAAP